MAACRERFLCDEMLARLGRWLRAAGYDVLIAAEGEEDKQLLQRAEEEDRLFITRDRKLLEHSGAAKRVVLLGANQLAGQLEELSWLCSIDWLCQPFSRCLECNSELMVADAEVRARVPAEALREGEDILYCPYCDQPYWYGSHARRMQRKLEHLSMGNWDANVEEDVTFINREKSE
jgi:uncharacterized protein with PIN domain